MMISGDFNIIRYLNEKNTMDGVHRHTPLFNSLIHFYELRELVMTGGLFTWSSNQENPVLEKLDRILVIKDWEAIFPQAIVSRLPREVSDHNPLCVSSRKTENNVHFVQFRSDLGWLQNRDFLPLVERVWMKPCRARTVVDKIQQKLKLFKQFFKGWGFNLQGELRKKKGKNIKMNLLS